jgi:hypothetical protein
LKAWKGWLIVGQLAHNARATPKVKITIRPWQWASTMTHLWCRFYKLKHDASSIQGVNYIVATMGYNYQIHIGIMIYPMHVTNILHCVIATMFATYELDAY